MAGSTFKKDLNNGYEKTVHWKKNWFMLPSGAAGKRYDEEVTRLMELWIQDTALKSIPLKAVHVVVLYFSKNQANSQKPKISSNINEVIKTV